MEEIFKKIIEIEHEAQGLVGQGISESEKIQLTAQADLRTMETNISEMAEHKIEQLKAQNMKEADDKIDRIHKHTIAKLKQIDQVVTENREIWEEQIYNRIFGR